MIFSPSLQLPSIRETVLDSAVKSAVQQVILKPELIIEPLGQLDEAEASERKQHANIVQHTEREMKTLQREEERILQAYRIALISPTQLGRQLEDLKAKRTALELRQSEVAPEPANGSAEVH